jgi:hypothetical protein
MLYNMVLLILYNIAIHLLFMHRLYNIFKQFSYAQLHNYIIKRCIMSKMKLLLYRISDSLL